MKVNHRWKIIDGSPMIFGFGNEQSEAVPEDHQTLLLHALVRRRAAGIEILVSAEVTPAGLLAESSGDVHRRFLLLENDTDASELE